jgi:hypothetical protein
MRREEVRFSFSCKLTGSHLQSLTEIHTRQLWAIFGRHRSCRPTFLTILIELENLLPTLNKKRNEKILA